MADVTAEPSAALLAGRRGLDAFDEVALLDDWAPDGNRWAIRVAITPEDLGVVYPVPPTTEWLVSVDPGYPAGLISILPAAERGLEGTYPHQMRGVPEVRPDVPFRDAKICVATNSEGNLARTDEVEPVTAHERLPWQVARAIRWVRDASHGELLKPGDPFELPVFAREASGIAVFESPGSFSDWSNSSRTGVAGLTAASENALVVIAWSAHDGSSTPKPALGTGLAESPQVASAAWLRLAAMPTVPPYAAPITWAELRQAAAIGGDDLDAMLREALAPLRDRPPEFLLIGFPVPAVVDGPPERIWWQPMDLPQIHGPRKPPRIKTAFRGNERGYWEADRALLFADNEPIRWISGENWHRDQLGTRGQLREELASQQGLLIGAGALGAPIAELLVRGGLRRLLVIDSQALVAGNLVRHTLTMKDVGKKKAASLAERLRDASPSGDVRSHVGPFPPDADEIRAAINETGLVIDTTGDDFVIGALAAYPWTGDRVFVSVSISYAARRLFLFVANGPSFPADEFRRQVAPWVALDVDAALELPWQGIGCWHPAFPARIDEIWLLASTAVAALNTELLDTVTPTLIVFERGVDADGIPTLIRRTDGP